MVIPAGWKLIGFSNVTTRQGSQNYAMAMGGEAGWELGIKTQPFSWGIYVRDSSQLTPVTQQQINQATVDFLNAERALEQQTPGTTVDDDARSPTTFTSTTTVTTTTGRQESNTSVQRFLQDVSAAIQKVPEKMYTTIETFGETMTGGLIDVPSYQETQQSVKNWFEDPNKSLISLGSGVSLINTGSGTKKNTLFGAIGHQLGEGLQNLGQGLGSGLGSIGAGLLPTGLLILGGLILVEKITD
jgi:hypothetical protein